MLQLENLSFQVADASASQKEIIKNLNLTIGDHRFIVIPWPN